MKKRTYRKYDRFFFISMLSTSHRGNDHLSYDFMNPKFCQRQYVLLFFLISIAK